MKYLHSQTDSSGNEGMDGDTNIQTEAASQCVDRNAVRELHMGMFAVIRSAEGNAQEVKNCDAEAPSGGVSVVCDVAFVVLFY